MPNTLKVQNFYQTNITSESIPSSGDFAVSLWTPPTYSNWYVVISAENIQQREIVYFHAVAGNTIYVRSENRWIGWTTAKEHVQGESVTMRDVAEIFNFYSDTISTCFFTEKTGWLTVKVWGWSVYYNTNLVTVPDTSLTLTDNTINYIKYSYTTNVISVDTINAWNIKVAVTVLSGVIISIVYLTAKETYTDFTVSLNTALPNQSGQAGKFLQSDWTNATWQVQSETPNSSTTVKWVVEMATLAETTAGTNTWSTWAPLVPTPGDVKALYAPIAHTHPSYAIVKNWTISSISWANAGWAAGTWVSGSTWIISSPTIAKITINAGNSVTSVRLYSSVDNITFSTIVYGIIQNQTIDGVFLLQEWLAYKLEWVHPGGWLSSSWSLQYSI